MKLWIDSQDPTRQVKANHRPYFPGDWIEAADGGAEPAPPQEEVMGFQCCTNIQCSGCWPAEPPPQEEVMENVPQIYYVLWSPALLRYYGARDTWVTDVAHARTFGIIGDAHMARDALKSAGLMREVDVFRVKVTLERV